MMFEIEYLWNGWFKKKGVNAKLIQYNFPNSKCTVDFTFSARLNKKIDDEIVRI